MDYQKAQEEQAHLKSKILALDKETATANFDLMQLKESIKMAEYEKDKEIRDRKALTEEFESTKVMVKEILFLNFGRKEKETNNRKPESVELRKAEDQTIKLEKSLEEVNCQC